MVWEAATAHLEADSGGSAQDGVEVVGKEAAEESVR